MAPNKEGMSKHDQEKLKKAIERNDKLIIMREELDKRADLVIQDRAMHRERREKEALEKGQVQSQDPAVRRRKDFMKDEYGLIDEVKDQQVREEKIRQNLMNSPEIQDLNKQLQVAYVRKQLQGQFEEKKLEQIKSSQTVGSDYEELQKVMKNEADSEEALRQKELDKKLEYRKTLQDQIINKYKLKQEEYREAMKERAVLEDALRLIIEEDLIEENRKRMMREKIKKEIEDFRNARALWTLREKELQEEEERKIKEYNLMKMQLEDCIKDQHKMKREDLERKKAIVSNIMSQRQDTRDDDEQAILQKYEDEQDKKALEKEKEELIKDTLSKKELIASFQRTYEDRRERQRREKEEDQEYIRQKLAEYREDKKCEEMSAEKRRRLKMAYKSYVLREIEEKRYRIRLEQEEEKERIRKEAIEQQERKKVINEERLRILGEHTGKLIGYLPPGILKNADLPHLPEQVKNFYSHDKPQQVATHPDKEITN